MEIYDGTNGSEKYNDADDIEKNNNANIEKNNDAITFNRGMRRIQYCYNTVQHIEQTGGLSTFNPFTILQKIFNSNTREILTRTIRTIIRSGSGISLDILTAGAGGDVIVDSVFAVMSNLEFIKNIQKIISKLHGTKTLLNYILKFNMRKTIPITSKLNLDEGFQAFETKFSQILTLYIHKYGAHSLIKTHNYINILINSVTTTVSDWLACLFPNTAGFAGEISKFCMDYIIKNGYDLIYNFISFLPNEMQKMVTNYYALQNMIKKAIIFLRDLITTMDSKKFSLIVKSLGTKSSNLTDNFLLKESIKFGSTVASGAISVGSKVVGAHPAVSYLQTGQKMIAYAINKAILPNVNSGVRSFNQLFPIFLMFTLFIQKFHLIKNGKYIPAKINTKYLLPPIPNITSNTEETNLDFEVTPSKK